ncbi:MAG: hypothetical protein SWN10_20835 [Pseudomonadota bacterium]|nr:hypothetical protein [Pseudomonadota bacterium]
MRFVSAELPSYCPGCGNKVNVGSFGLADFTDGASQSCNHCDTEWAFAPESKVTDLASEHGDADRYWR